MDAKNFHLEVLSPAPDSRQEQLRFVDVSGFRGSIIPRCRGFRIQSISQHLKHAHASLVIFFGD